MPGDVWRRKDIACGKNSISNYSGVGKDRIYLGTIDSTAVFEHRTHIEEKWKVGLEGR